MTDTRHRLRAILAADAAGYSRLMSLDDRGTVEALEAARRVFRQCVEEHAGRIVDTAGDSVLAVFETATGAVTAALDIQKTLADSGVGIPEDRRMSFRIGVHMGDVIEKGDGTVYGAGVNIAARLQALAETGGVTVSDAVRALVKGRVAASFVDLGVQRLKNIDEPIQVFKCNVSDTLVPASTARAGIGLKQTIRYCSAPNGMSIAWSTMGRGSPVVWCAMYGHLEQALLTEAARTFFHDLSRQHTLIRYDGIGSGLSDRSVEDPSIERAVADMECVVDAARLDKFAVVAANRGSHGAITFSARHPEKVTRLVLIGAHARGLMRRNPTPEQLARYNALLAAVEAGWSEASPAWRTLYTHSGNSGTTREELLSHAEVNRMSVSAQYMVRYLRAEADADVSEQARTVNCPVLVLHSRDDPTFEEGRRMASLFPDVRFVPLNSRNNFIWPSDPVYTEAMGEILNFLSSD